MNSLMEMRHFFREFKIDPKRFDQTGMMWNEIVAICNEHSHNISEYKSIENYFADCLRRVQRVHSVKTRIKDVNHLAEKIIRKKIENKELLISLDNYKDMITDLIGIRVLHLFKDDWLSIHDYIINKWDLAETPVANIRKGDALSIIEAFKAQGCNVNEHKYGYRSVHYLAKARFGKDTSTVEIQVRTIFEEGWSEIDHTARYPYNRDDDILLPFLMIFNNLAGSADEMGSYVMYLRQQIEELKQKHSKEITERDKTVKELRQIISKLEVEQSKKEELQKHINGLMITPTTISDLKLPKSFEFAKVNAVLSTVIPIMTALSVNKKAEEK